MTKEDKFDDEMKPKEASEETAEESSEDLTAKIEKYRLEAQEYKDKYLRLAAEYDNYRKRQARIFDEMVSAAQDGLLHQILSILDNFERAMESTKGDVDKKTVIEGIELIYKQLQDMLEAENITEICPVGECFDPNVHEAVSVIPCDEDEKVVEVIQKGYRRGDRLVRPARVIVGKSQNGES